MAPRSLSSLALLSALLLAACAGTDPAPTTSSPVTTPASSPAPTPTSSPAPTPTEEPTPELSVEDLTVGDKPTAEELATLFPLPPRPAEPAGLTENTDEGAMASAAYFWELFTYANLTDQPDVIDEMTFDGCLHCESLKELVGFTLERDIYFTPEILTPTEVTRRETLPHLVNVEVDGLKEFIVYVDRETGLIDEILTDHVETDHFLLEFRDGRWIPISLFTDVPNW